MRAAVNLFCGPVDVEHLRRGQLKVAIPAGPGFGEGCDGRAAVVKQMFKVPPQVGGQPVPDLFDFRFLNPLQPARHGGLPEQGLQLKHVLQRLVHASPCHNAGHRAGCAGLCACPARKSGARVDYTSQMSTPCLSDARASGRLGTNSWAT